MGERLFLYTADGVQTAGPVSADWLFQAVAGGQLPAEIQVREVGTEEWLSFTSLPDSAFSLRVLAKASEQTRAFAEADQLHLSALDRLFQCQSEAEAHGYRTANLEQIARDGLEFVDAALQLAPGNPKYLNTKALLLADGLGQKESGLALLQQAAELAPKDIQIQQNIRALTNRSEGCLVLVGIALLLLLAGAYSICHASLPSFLSAVG